MKERLRWFLIGVGVMYLMQVLILFLIHHLIPATAPPEFSTLIGTVVYTLIAFLAGGFVIGWMAERIEIIEPTLATIVTLGIDVITSQTGIVEWTFPVHVCRVATELWNRSHLRGGGYCRFYCRCICWGTLEDPGRRLDKPYAGYLRTCWSCSGPISSHWSVPSPRNSHCYWSNPFGRNLICFPLV